MEKPEHTIHETLEYMLEDLDDDTKKGITELVGERNQIDEKIETIKSLISRYKEVKREEEQLLAELKNISKNVFVKKETEKRTYPELKIKDSYQVTEISVVLGKDSSEIISYLQDNGYITREESQCEIKRETIENFLRKECLTRKELANILNVTTQAISQNICAGKLYAFRFGKSIYLTKRSLEKFLLNSSKPLVSIPNAAKLLNCEESNVRYLMKKARIKATRGKRYLFNGESYGKVKDLLRK